jgi:hypothetical protein
VQELLGHTVVETTMIYTHVMTKPGLGVRSPLDGWYLRWKDAIANVESTRNWRRDLN